MKQSPVDMLAEIGRVLYGEHWVSPMAEALHVNADTIRKWLRKPELLTARHGIFDELLTILAARQETMAQHFGKLCKWLKHNR